MILIENLKAGYFGNSVLNGVDAVFASGAVHGLLGLNGSGKTTLLRAVYGLVKPDEGRVLIDGAAASRKQMAFLEAEQYFYHNITAAEYLELLSGSSSFDFIPWLDVFSLPSDVFIDEFSTGMKKKLAFIGVVALGRPVLLLDEPFNGLDMESSRILSKVLVRMKKSGKTILVTSHILGSLTEICDTMLLLKDGKVSRTFDDSTTFDIEREVFKDLDEATEQKLSKLSGI